MDFVSRIPQAIDGIVYHCINVDRNGPIAVYDYLVPPGCYLRRASRILAQSKQGIIDVALCELMFAHPHVRPRKLTATFQAFGEQHRERIALIVVLCVRKRKQRSLELGGAMMRLAGG